MDYEGIVYRPPSEARSLIIQVTIGCAPVSYTHLDVYKRQEYGWEVMDAFLDDMKEEDPDLLILSGDLTVSYTHLDVYKRQHPMTVKGVSGVYFAVWAPESMRVSVVGDFNLWDGRRSQMRRLGDSGVFEI